MQSVQIIVGHHWKQDVRFLKNLRQYRRFDSELNLIEIRDIIDIVVDGTNITSNVAEESIFGVLSELLDAVARLLEGRARKEIVEFHCEPWEMVLVPDGRQFLISLYSIDRHHRVIAHDIPIAVDKFVEALSDAAESLLTDLYRISEGFSADTFVRLFSSRLGRIQDYKRPTIDNEESEAPQEYGERRGGTSSPNGLTLSYSFDADHRALRDYCGEHDFDLHALLFPGEIVAEYDGRTIEMTRGYPLLTVHGLLKRTRQLLNLLEASEESSFQCDEKMRHARFDVSAEGPRWRMTMGTAVQPGESIELSSHPRRVLDIILSVCEMLLADVLSVNAHLELNHRISDLEAEVRELRGWFEDISGSNSYHDEPESFIAELGHVTPEPTPQPREPRFPWPLSSVHALFPRPTWQFAAERIELDSIVTTADGLLVPTSEAMYYIDADSGKVRWKHGAELNMARVSHAVAGERLLVAEDAGGVELIDLHTGNSVLQNRSIPVSSWKRLIGAAAYPAESRLVACDLHGRILGLSSTTGELDWTFSSGHGRFAGVTYQGPLIMALTGEGFLYSINPIDGQTLWKVRLGGLSANGPQFHQGRLYSLSHDSLHQKLTVHSLYPFTGRTSWQLRIDGILAGQASFVDEFMIVPVERHGQLSLHGIDVERTEPRVEWTLDLSSAGMDDPTPVLCHELDGRTHGLIKTDRAEISCFEISTGELRWRATPADETWLLHGNLPLVSVEDALLGVADEVELRHVATGELLHTLDQPVKAPEFVAPFGELSVVVGTRGTSSDSVDVLSCLKLDHFLALVEDSD
ncbi:MAG: PQQ-binding-like beta-propeller repeat protein, partial [Persicimonas sp.]